MKILTWQKFNDILIVNSVDRIKSKNGKNPFLQHYESYFTHTEFGSGRAVNIELKEGVHFSSLDVKLENDVLIPNEYPVPVLALYLCINGKVEVDFGTEILSGGQWGFYSVPAGVYDFRIHGTQEKQYQVIGVHFNHKSFRKFMGDSYELFPSEITHCIEHLFPYVKTGSYSPELHERILQLTHGKFDQLHDKLKLESLIYELMSYVVKSFKDRPKIDSHHYKTMSTICKLIMKRPFSTPSKASLAQKVGMSESLFYKVFKSIYGVSPNQFIVDHKLIAARKLLETEDISVKEVAFRAGYESVSSFSRVFNNRFGYRPGEIIRGRT